jgi:phenylpropionate dioxygenase-like ring-hydroxylating dioxygenase large terminal subunit
VVANEASRLSTKPTGWFQVAWSAEIGPKEVVPMRYFGQDLVAYRAESGDVKILDAYCQHLGANLGFGGKVEGECIRCPFHGWLWNGDGRNELIPYQTERNSHRRIRSWHVAEKNESVYLWHDVEGRDPLFPVQDIFTEMYDDGATADDYYPAYPNGAKKWENKTLHPQMVMENGVDFAHFQYVHRSGSLPRFTYQKLDTWTFDTSFEMTFGEGKAPTALTPNGEIIGGVHAHTEGLGIGAALFWGPDTMRTIVSATPVDDTTSTLFSTVWLPRRPDADGNVDTGPMPEKLQARMDMATLQVERDLNIWSHQIYLEPPSLATSEGTGYRAVRNWAKRFYPDVNVEEAQAAAQEGAETPQAISADLSPLKDRMVESRLRYEDVYAGLANV